MVIEDSLGVYPNMLLETLAIMRLLIGPEEYTDAAHESAYGKLSQALAIERGPGGSMVDPG